MGIDSDRTFHFDADVAQVWAAFERTDDYRSWWPWLRRFEATGLASGDCWRCTVQPPMPYSLSFSIELIDVVPRTEIAAEVTGDIAGDARLILGAAEAGGTDLRLVSSLEPRRATLAAVTAVAPWVARLGHDWVLDSGRRQFARHAI